MEKHSKYSIFKSVLILLNLIFGLLLALSISAPYFSAGSYSLVAVSGLFYPVLLFTNIIFILVWVFLDKKYGLFSLIVILMGFNSLMNTFNYSVFNSSKKDNNDIKILSYNVQQFKANDNFSKLIITNDILSFMIEEEADIVCLQEYQSHNKNIYEPLKETRDTLNAGTYYYESYFNPRYNYLTGLVTFSKFKAVDKGKLKIEGSRSFGIYTDLLIKGDTIRVFNIHLASISLNNTDIEFVINPEMNNNEDFKNKVSTVYNKLAQAFQLREKQLVYLKNEISKSPYEIILAGDFNDTPSSMVYSKVSKDLEDSFLSKGFGMGITYAGKLPLLRIDYIFKSSNFKTKEFNTHNLLRSDHYPVSAILTKN